MAKKAKPTTAKILQGTFRKDRAAKNEVKHKAVKDIKPPNWMDGLALKKWNELAPVLQKSGVLTEVDIHNLEAFCVSYQTWRLAVDEIDKEGITMPTVKGGIQKNPAVTVSNESLKNMAMYGSQLGLDPSSRTKISGRGGDNKDNPFAKL